MRDDYNALLDKIKNDNFTDISLSRNEYAKLLTAALIVTNNLKDQIITMQKVIKGYETVVAPKLQRIINETTTNDEALTLANELFKEKS